MTQNRVSAGVLLVESLLADAKQDLEANNLDKAWDLFKDALDVQGGHPHRANTIREALKQYSDRVTRQTPPNWAEARRALELLNSLEALQNNENYIWQRDLGLDEANHRLSQGELDQSFDIFSKLLDKATDKDEVKGKISEIVRENFPEQASQGDFNLLDRIIERVQKLGLAGDELRLWLETIRKALDAANKAAEERLNQELLAVNKVAQDELRRRQNIIIALVVILILTVIAYFVVVFPF